MHNNKIYLIINMLDFNDYIVQIEQYLLQKKYNKLLNFTNINFGKILWSSTWSESIIIFSDIVLVSHLVDHTNNIFIKEKYVHNNCSMSLCEYILRANNIICISYLVNSVGVDIIPKYVGYAWLQDKYIYHSITKKYNCLSNGLKIISLNTNYMPVNILKYYDKCPLMLFINKYQKILPKTIIKHIIIPFIYTK